MVTGWFGNGTAYTRAQIQAMVDAAALFENRAASGVGYDNLAWPQGSTNYYMISYYDDYNFLVSQLDMIISLLTGRLPVQRTRPVS